MKKRSGDAESVNRFHRIVESYWSFHAYPEGLTHETENADPTIDNPGCKQAFSMKGWFCDALELHLGLKVCMDGFSLHPLNTGKAFRVENLVLRGKKLTLERRPDGTLLLNGTPVPAGKSPWETFAGL